MPSIRPAPGTVVELDENFRWNEVAELIDFDFDNALDDAVDHITGRSSPFVVVGGPLKIEGDASSETLAKNLAGFTSKTGNAAWQRGYVVIVLGDLEVSGHLEVIQYHDLIVAGSLRAKSVRGHSSNLIVTKATQASELVVFEENEEGGVYYAPVTTTPLLVQFGCEFDIELNVEGEKANNVQHPQRLKAATEAAGYPVSSSFGAGFHELERCLNDGNARRFIAAYASLESEDAVLAEIRKRRSVKPFLMLKTSNIGFATGIRMPSYTEMFICGGQGENMLLYSNDRGVTFAPIGIPLGRGLRDILKIGDEVWICGQFGLLLYSDDGGKSFDQLDIGAPSCLQTLLRSSDGTFWCTGDPGAYKSPDGREWVKADVDGEVVRPKESALGVLLPTSTGHLVVAHENVLTTTSLRAEHELWAVGCSPTTGTTIAVGAKGQIYRSDDQLSSWKKVDAGVSFSVENVECTDHGIFIAVGQNGLILASHDDGVSFQRVTQDYNPGWLFGIARHGNKIFVGGERGLVLEIA